MAAKKSSAVSEILKREKQEKALAAEKIEKEKQALATASSVQVKEVAKAAITAQVQKSKTIAPIEIALSQYRDDIRYYFLYDQEYGSRIKEIFQENENMLKRHHIDAKKYLEYMRESFERYKKIHGLLPLEPMKPKYFQYLEDSIKELIRMFDQRFGK